MQAVFRAVGGYFFLLLMLRIVGRRPGKQLTPFEFVLIFFIGGLGLTGIVGDDGSITNALCQIVSLALAHQGLTWARFKWKWVARLVDGTPLFLMNKGDWQEETMSRMRIQREDVLFSGRDKGLRSADEMSEVLLERNGEITVLEPKKPSGQGSR